MKKLLISICEFLFSFKPEIIFDSTSGKTLINSPSSGNRSEHSGEVVNEFVANSSHNTIEFEAKSEKIKVPRKSTIYHEVRVASTGDLILSGFNVKQDIENGDFDFTYRQLLKFSRENKDNSVALFKNKYLLFRN